VALAGHTGLTIASLAGQGGTTSILPAFFPADGAVVKDERL